MNVQQIRWNRSEEGYVTSKCGRFSISPLFYGRTTAQDYVVEYKADASTPSRKVGTCSTIREAKADAQRALESMVLAAHIQARRVAGAKVIREAAANNPTRDGLNQVANMSDDELANAVSGVDYEPTCICLATAQRIVDEFVKRCGDLARAAAPKTATEEFAQAFADAGIKVDPVSAVRTVDAVLTIDLSGQDVQVKAVSFKATVALRDSLGADAQGVTHIAAECLPGFLVWAQHEAQITVVTEVL